MNKTYEELQDELVMCQDHLAEALEREKALAAQIERLDNELQGKALTDDGVLADAYWDCADKITPWLGEKTVPDTLINSVCGSLDFLIEQWREKKALEQHRDRRELIKQAEALEEYANSIASRSEIGLMETAVGLRQQAAAL